MSYSPRKWQDGETVTAEILNELEERIGAGVASAPTQVSDASLSALLREPDTATSTALAARIQSWVADGTIPTDPDAEVPVLRVVEVEPGVYEISTGPIIAEEEPGVYVFTP